MCLLLEAFPPNSPRPPSPRLVTRIGASRTHLVASRAWLHAWVTYLDSRPEEAAGEQGEVSDGRGASSAYLLIILEWLPWSLGF